jgi:hypothetical protein
VNKDGFGVREDAVGADGNVKVPLRNGQPDDSAARGANAGSGAASADELDGMTKAELTDYAEARGIDLGDAKTKAEIVDAIVAAQK